MLASFAILERLIPYDPTWHAIRREWAPVRTYFLLILLGGGIA